MENKKQIKIMYIYGLYSILSIDEYIRYIGQTRNLIKRLNDHNNNFVNIDKLTKKEEWIKKVINSGGTICMKVIEICDSTNFNQREKHWITEFRKTNHLTNTLSGGGGYIEKSLYNISYEDCKKWVKDNLNISSSSQWWKNAENNLPKHIPKYPNDYFVGMGWISWSDFLDNNNISSNLVVDVYYSYDDAKKWISENTSGITYHSTWKEEVKNNKIPYFIPNRPDRFYKRDNRGWISWGDFLGTGTISCIQQNKNYLSYENSKKYINENFPFILGSKDWNKNYANKIPNFIPKNPNNTYKKDGWINWIEFLSHGDFVAGRTSYYLYEELKKINEENVILNWKSYDYLRNKSTNSNKRFPPAEHIRLQKDWKNDDDFFNKIKFVNLLPSKQKSNIIKKYNLPGFDIRTDLKWTLESCKKEALKYKNPTEWIKGSNSSYNMAMRNKWLSKIYFLIGWEVKDPKEVIYTYDICKIEALKFDTRSNWRLGSKASYDAACRNGWLDDLARHMKTPSKNTSNKHLFDENNNYIPYL